MKKRLFLYGVVVLVVLVTQLFYSAGLFSKFENSLEDLLVTTKKFSPEIVILAIDNESLSRLGQWPWPRRVYADLLQVLETAPPKALGIDVALFEPSRLGVDDDQRLVEALASTSFPVVLSTEADPLILDQEGKARIGVLRSPLSDFLSYQNVSAGLANLILDGDGIVRKFPTRIVLDENKELKTFSYQLFSVAEKRRVVLEGVERIVYARTPGTIRKFHLSDVFENKDLVQQLSGKFVLVGATAPDLHDVKLTPISRGVEMPGVEIQANILNMLLEGYRLYPIHQYAMRAWLLIAAILPLFFFVRFKGIARPLIGNVVVGIVHTSLAVVLFENGLVANILHINLSWVLSTLSLFVYTYFATEKERREMRKLFSKYVARDVLEYIMKNPDKVSLGGEEKVVTILFSDIRNYTTFSETVKPKELISVLNRYLTAMTEEVLKNKGVLDKYIGDAVMAYWGAPIDDPDHADRAIETAFGMIKRLEKFNAELRAEGIQEIHFGIGIYTGPVIIGNVGSEMRLEYTVVGDTVNVASRLEGVNKELGTTILVGEATKKSVKGNYPFKSMGSVSVKGRKEPIAVYTIEGV